MTNMTHIWLKQKKDDFYQINQDIIDAPTIFSPNYGKGFLIYTFSLDSSIVAILTQKDVEGNEWPISFMSAALQGSKLNYLSIYKHTYVIYKEFK